MKRKRASAGAPGAAPFDFVGMSCPCCYRPGGARSLFCGERACAPDDAPKKLAGLRALMRECGVAAYVVPSEDAHASEYVAAADERLSWLTGFTGSAGVALVTETHALLWTDARYFLQAAEQLGAGWTLMKMYEPGVAELHEWVATRLRPGDAVGVDGALVSAARARDSTHLTSGYST